MRPPGTPAPSRFWVLWILYMDFSPPLASWFCPTFGPICPGTFILPLLQIRGHLPDVSRLSCFGLSLHLYGCGVGGGGGLIAGARCFAFVSEPKTGQSFVHLRDITVKRGQSEPGTEISQSRRIISSAPVLRTQAGVPRFCSDSCPNSITRV